MRLLLILLFTSSLCLSQEVLLSENFSDGLPEDWTAETTNSQRNWMFKNFRDFNYMQMSAFGGRGKPGYKVKASLQTPLLDISDKECKLKFSFADAYKNGQPLYVSLINAEKKPLKNLNPKDWESLVNNEAKYDNNEESTPWIPLPKIQQAYHISFIYDSQKGGKKSKPATTIIQLSEVDVWCE